MANGKIKEIYLYAIYAKYNGQSKIPVYIFPFKMTAENMASYKLRFKDDHELLNFWGNIKRGYDNFINETKELKYSVADNGDYKFYKE